MPRQFKIELEDGHNYEFFLHDDNKIETEDGVSPMPLTHYIGYMNTVKVLADIMRDTGLNKTQITRL